MPLLLKREKDRILLAFKGRLVCVIFDTSTRVDEIMAVIIRYVSDDFTIVQELIHLSKYSNCKNNEQIANAVHRELASYFPSLDAGSNADGSSRLGSVLAFQRDRASSNEVAVKRLVENYIGSMDLKCLSHTITHCGEHIPLEYLKGFKENLCQMMNANGGANKSRPYWMTVFDRSWNPPGNTRWWATFELFVFIYENWERLLHFVNTATTNGQIEGSLILNLQEAVRDPRRKEILRFEAAVIAKTCLPLIKETYTLEGDSCCSLIAYDIIQGLKDWFEVNLDTVSFQGLPEEIHITARELASAPEQQDADVIQLMDNMKAKAYSMIEGAKDYFDRTILGILGEDIRKYQACRLVNPFYASVKLVRGNPQSIRLFMEEFQELVRGLGRFTDDEIRQMTQEIATYKGHLRDGVIQELPGDPADQMTDCLDFWKRYYQTMPALAKLARVCITIAPSSASVERVFSILKSTFSVNQMSSSLEDYTALSVMLQSNKKNSNYH